MAEYKYGVYGVIGDSIITSGDTVATVPVYIGTAPANLVRGYAEKELVNTPIRIQSLTDALRKLGYNNDWESFTLCEAMSAHFADPNGVIGPAYFINVLDPDVHVSEMPTTESLAVVRNKAEIRGTHMILDSVKIARPLTDPAPIGQMATKEDANAALSSVGNPVTDAAAHTVYVILDKPLGAEGDYLMLVETSEHTYGLNCLASKRKPTSFKFYAQLTDGKMVDWVDGAKKVSDDAAKLDLSTYTGELKVSLASCKYKDAENYPTDIVPIVSKTIEVDSGQSPQYYEEDRDYTLTYNPERGAAVIEDLTENMPGSVEVTYSEVDDTQVTADDVIGDKTPNGEYSGIYAVNLVFNLFDAVPNIIAAPGFSHIPEVYKTLCKCARKINGHWDAVVFADMPIVDGDMNPIDTIDLAIKWKDDNAYDDERSKVFWPQVVDTEGRICHISALATAEQMRVDASHNGIPFESCGNKSVSVRSQYFGEETRNRGFDQTDANELTAKGITTVAPWGTDYRIWGDHTAAYGFEEDDYDARAIFDVTLRMLLHITNSFQLEWADEIDEPMTRALKDRIVNREQEKLDSLVAQGALLGNPTVEFSPDVTSADILQGRFVWNLQATVTPPLKSAEAVVVYTDEGFSALLDAE